MTNVVLRDRSCFIENFQNTSRKILVFARAVSGEVVVAMCADATRKLLHGIRENGVGE